MLRVSYSIKYLMPTNLGNIIVLHIMYACLGRIVDLLNRLFFINLDQYLF